MRTRVGHACIGLLAAAFSWTGAQAGPSSPNELPPTRPQALIEADWLYQARIRGERHPMDRPATAADDAAGGCDGVRNGSYGFHTDRNDRPSWWQVDLGKSEPLDRVVIFNRCDFPPAPVPQPTAKLEIQCSLDGQSWQTAYTHDGSRFLGHVDQKPLIVPLKGAPARWLRVQTPPHTYLHFDEVEVYSTAAPGRNLAMNRPADQSSVSQWSVRKRPAGSSADKPLPIAETIDRGRKLAAELKEMGRDTQPALAELAAIERALASSTDPSAQRPLYLRARKAVRSLALSNPLLDFDRIVFVKRALGSFSHMSDQYYSWFSRPGGGIYVLEGFKTDAPRLRCLTPSFPEGSFLAPDVSYDGKKILFSYCRYYPGRSALPNKLDKAAQAEDSFYHLFEIGVDGTGLRQITRGRYDDLFPRYLPNGEIVFLSTRRGQSLQCNQASAMETLQRTLPDSFVRCGGDASRPVAVYTLHTMDPSGQWMRAISPFENFEWDPSISNDGRILYARWDYVDRDNMPYMKLWAANPDGTSPQAVWGNYTRSPQCAFEPRAVPNSRKIVFTAAAHHAITGGSLVLFDPTMGVLDGHSPLTRLTPEVLFPESEGWSEAYFANPCPLSERHFLTAWGAPLQPGCPPQANWGQTGPTNALGVYLFDTYGNLELLHRDPALCSMYPLPVRPRPLPPTLASAVDWHGPQEGRLLVLDAYAGLTGVQRGAIKAIRIIAMPAKTQPDMNTPQLGVTADDPGKCVMGTVPVEADGSAHFRVPSGVALFFQVLDSRGRAIQTMRSLTCVQPGQTLSCIGCHESRGSAPAGASRPIAAARAPSRIKPGPEGSWPLRFDQLVQPVLDRACISCHQPGAADPKGARVDLTPSKSWNALMDYGRPSLRETVRRAYAEGRSAPNAGPAMTSPLLSLLNRDEAHYGAQLTSAEMDRLITWMDAYGQRLGSYSAEQEAALAAFRQRATEFLERP